MISSVSTLRFETNKSTWTMTSLSSRWWRIWLDWSKKFSSSLEIFTVEWMRIEKSWTYQSASMHEYVTNENLSIKSYLLENVMKMFFDADDQLGKDEKEGWRLKVFLSIRPSHASFPISCLPFSFVSELRIVSSSRFFSNKSQVKPSIHFIINHRLFSAS